MKIAIIGSGISAISVAKTFLEANYEIYLYDADSLNSQKSNKKSLSFLPSTSVSPKFNDNLIKKGIIKFKKVYRLKMKNFFLASPLLSGGMSNFWGGGIQIPEKKYLKKNSYSEKILKETKNLNYFLNMKKNIHHHYNDFFKLKFIQSLLKNNDQKIFFKKLGICASHDEKNEIFNSKKKIKYLEKNKLFKYMPNSFVKSINKIKNKYTLTIANKKKNTLKFDKVIICAGTIGSTLLISKMLKINKEIKLYHTPAFKLAYFNPFLIFKKTISRKYKHPLLELNYRYKNHNYRGSIICAKNLENNFFGVKDYNFIFSWLKNFLLIGNFFLTPESTDTFIKKNKKGFIIYSNIKKIYDIDYKNIKNSINKFLRKFLFIEIPYLNFSKFLNGSDAHYTSTLYNLKINQKKILRKHCEIEKFKNLHVLDGSVIAEGLLYPTYFIMLNAIFISKQIITNDKKNKNIN